MEFQTLDLLKEGLAERLGESVDAELNLGSNWFGLYGREFVDNGAGNLVLHAQRQLSGDGGWALIGATIT